jgi:hypothetical protein
MGSAAQRVVMGKEQMENARKVLRFYVAIYDYFIIVILVNIF